MSTGIIPIIKQAALEAVEASNPANYVYGTVTNTDPLEITITPKLILNENDGVLKLTRNVTDYTVTALIDWETNLGSISSVYPITFRNALKKGEVVLMGKMKGGQSYIVLDRVV